MTQQSDLERKLLRRDSSYRRGRMGCIAVAAVTLVACLIAAVADPSDKVFIVGSSAQVLFWLALAYAAHARVQHVETIKRVRHND